MTGVEHGPTLSQPQPAPGYLPIAVRHGESLVGFGLARAAPSGGEILSLVVQPDWWSRGVGTHLLAMLEEGLARGWGCTVARVGFTTQGPSAPAFARVLQKRGWSSPVTHALTWQLRPPPIAAKPWMQSTPLPLGDELFPWTELRAEDRAALEAARGEIDPTLWPLADEPLQDPHASVGLRRGGEVIGWMILHRIAPDVLRFTALYVRERWRSRRMTMRLLAEAIRRKEAFYPPFITILLAIRVENEAMRRLLARRFKRYAERWWEMRSAEKQLELTPPAAAVG